MTVQEAIEYINRHTWSQWKLGLGRTEELLRRLGDPQKRLRFIHVAGSNGKGSTCAMLERILRAAGYRTGLYPSPYIEDFRERIQVNGAYITEEALCRITAQVAAQADAMEDHPSQFELITAIGMVYFAEERCDFVVLEVGLGGTFDSTNVIDAPEVAVITNLGLEHTEYLGNTLPEIAAAKGGIIKHGSDVVCYESDEEALRVIRGICEEKKCRLHIARHAEITPLQKNLSGQRFFARGKIFRLSLLGEYQLRNASTVLTVIDVLRERGFAVPEKAVEEGLADVQWPARFEVLCREPLLILDGGHNPQCAEALAESLNAYLPGQQVTFLTGILADKDVEKILDTLAPCGARYVCVTPDSPRAMPGEELAKRLRE
ncbi:MAG: bifunctional folylpolyglutamate synthase/dihydrofolate synthase, partial [Lachnospiraceae bacterium]|nr:bifunctional folylpolyglutamate synthase/dihydrofolate synthase [Lachnospiraceae bacterium]